MNDNIVAPINHTKSHNMDLLKENKKKKATNLNPNGMPGFLMIPAVLINSSSSKFETL